MPALLKFLVPLAIFLSANNANAFTSLSPVAGSQVQENHFKQFEAVNGINTSYTFEAVNGVNVDASQPTVAKTSEGDKISEGA